ncbi:MAG: hypothetical protein EKK47_07840 [Burkholderiales bacterium]|nr:MAG: hypothetical protein EKK47_07840 [Burkholderiales bacterium]
MSSAPNQEKTYTFYRPIKSVTVSDIKQMYDLYSSYYENTSLDIFLNDLSKKTGVILVTRKSDGKVVGFSTQVVMTLKIDGKLVRGVFSGDTIIEPRYWGNNKLGVVFYRFLFKIRLRHPITPFYWFLISKGYKTYMLMTNNCYKYYPSVNGNSEEHKRITQAYCEQLFPESFDKDKMLLDFGERYVRLKEAVAEITPELAAANPKIAYFEKMNPTWRRGTELPCLGSLDFHSALISFYARPMKWIQKYILRNYKPEGLELAKQLEAERVAASASDALGRSKG